MNAVSSPLRIAIDPIEQTGTDTELVERTLRLDGQSLLELGCGSAQITRKLAQGGPGRRMLALEVDRIQHEKNLLISDLPNVEFRLAGAEAIPAADASFDTAFMFKSLHHVPLELMPRALAEIARVLRPGGHAWLAEPIFAGPLNEITRLFHDERLVRQAAFDAIRGAIHAGLLESAQEIFYLSPTRYADFREYESRVIGATHSRHVLSPETYAEVKRRFEAHLGPDGARFQHPMRVNLLRKPG